MHQFIRFVAGPTLLMCFLSACGGTSLLWGPPADDTGVCLTGTDKRVFITSTTHNGNFEGFSGADDFCNTRAQAAGLGGKWIAYVTIQGKNAKERLRVGVSAWKLITGTTVFTSTCTIPVALTNVNVDENGATLNGSAWTGTDIDGSTSPAGTCNDWKSNSASLFAAIGVSNWALSGFASTEWANRALSTCDEDRHIYCFER